jgi:hypothetical protein
MRSLSSKEALVAVPLGASRTGVIPEAYLIGYAYMAGTAYRCPYRCSRERHCLQLF